MRPTADAAEPIAAAFLPAGPGSSKAVPAAAGSSGSLYVITSDGLLTHHLLLAPPAPAGTAGSTPAAASGLGAGAALERQESSAATGTAAAAVLEEADRWNVARHASWPEHEEPLPGLLECGAPGAAAAPSPAEQQQLWVAQAEPGALAGAGADGGAAAGATPLWRDPQFRCYELEVQGLGVASAAPAEAGPSPADELAARLQSADLGGGADAPCLEALAARPVQLPQ